MENTGKELTVSNEALGPAMAALSAQQRAFVVAMFDMGATYADAARKAGYADTGGIRVQAHRLAHNEKVQAAFREEAERRATGLLPIAHTMMAQIVANPSHPDHFKAIRHSQALAGVSPTQKHEVIHRTDTASLKADLLAAMDLLKSIAGPMIDITPKQAIIDNLPPDEDWTAI